MARGQLEHGFRRIRRTIPHHYWAALKERVHPALARSLRRALVSVPDLGRVSVVVPCYRVEDYLADCLTSIISQSYPHLEIIVVIDGSPDRSAEIARSFARWDRRITVVEQPNGGLGNARNTGIARATGDFIAFADSDDIVPPGAYATMVGTLTETGSDFVVGNLARREGTRTWVPKWAEDVHREDRLGVTLDDMPEILADVFSWNKLFRRPFFDAVVGTFPERVRYEDQEPTARAYAAARSFDVLSTVVYHWYVRDDGSSITQQKADIRDLADRLRVMGAVSAVLADGASPHVVEQWHAKSIGLDLRSYYYEVPRTDEEYWQLLRTGVQGIVGNMDEMAWAAVDLHDRVLARLVERDQREDVCTVLRLREEFGDGVRVDPAPARPTGEPVYLEELETRLEPEDLLLSPRENRLTAGLTGYRVVGDEIEVSGYAYVEGIDLGVHASTLSVRLVPETEDEGPGEAGRPSHQLAVRRTHLPALDEVVNSASVSQADAAFVARFSPSVLAGDRAAAAERWHVELTLDVADKSWTSGFRPWERRGTANVLEHGPLVDGSRVVPRFSPERGLEFSVRRVGVVAVDAALDGRTLLLDLRTEGGPGADAVEASCVALGRTVRVPVLHGDGTSRAALVIPPLPPGAPPRKEYTWLLQAVTADGALPLEFAGGTLDLPPETAAGTGLALALAPTGELVLSDQRTRGAVREVALDEWPEAFVVRGVAVLPPGQDFLVALASQTDLWEPTDASHDPVSGEFEARFAVRGERWGRSGLAQPSRGRSLRLLRHPGTTRDSLWVPVAPGPADAVTRGFLAWHGGPACDIRFTLTSRARALWVNVRGPLAEDEVGRRAQLALKRSVPALLARPLREQVLFSSFGGRHAADSPLGIHHELERRGYDGDLLWAVADHSSVVPAGARSLVVGSRAYYEALHTSRWLVNNNNFPHYFRKRPDQRYLQTWHGTPLKRIGRDVPSGSLSLSYRALMDREVAAWDVLLAQNEFAAEALPSAFGYEGETLTLGYPRNDVLGGTPDLERVARVRQALGVPTEGRVLLYAPTWRDNRRTENRQYALVNHLELDQVSRALAGGWTVLVRGHSNTPGLSVWDGYPGIVDVSDFPDVADLMLVADVLVTDYSSVMFDFVVTGRPMLFLVPDLAEYGGRTRGFYLDFPQIAPGPLLDTTGGVVEAVRALAGGPLPGPDERYLDFRRRFAPLDDGRAAERVVDAVWGPRT
jgi:CDP-glycerol glycerophosphotransferase